MNSESAVDPGAFPDLDKAKVGINIDPKYHEFKDGETIRCFFCGLTWRNIKGEKLLTAVFQMKEGFIMNSGKSLVSQLPHLQPGTPVQVAYLGKKTVGDKGERTNLFQVNVLSGVSAETQAVAVPSPSGAAAAPKLESGTAEKPKISRPLDPETLRRFFPKKIEKHSEKRTIVTQAQRGILAVTLDTTFEGDKNKRKVLTGWLIGRAHIKEMSQAEVAALLDWLECKAFDSVPPDYVIKEARAAYAVALKTIPQTGE